MNHYPWTIIHGPLSMNYYPWTIIHEPLSMNHYPRSITMYNCPWTILQSHYTISADIDHLSTNPSVSFIDYSKTKFNLSAVLYLYKPIHSIRAYVICMSGWMNNILLVCHMTHIYSKLWPVKMLLYKLKVPSHNTHISSAFGPFLKWNMILGLWLWHSG